MKKSNWGFNILYHGINYPESGFTRCESTDATQAKSISSMKELYSQHLKYFRGCPLHYKFLFVSEHVVRGKGCTSLKKIRSNDSFSTQNPSKVEIVKFLIVPQRPVSWKVDLQSMLLLGGGGRAEEKKVACWDYVFGGNGDPRHLSSSSLASWPPWGEQLPWSNTPTLMCWLPQAPKQQFNWFRI